MDKEGVEFLGVVVESERSGLWWKWKSDFSDVVNLGCWVIMEEGIVREGVLLWLIFLFFCFIILCYFVVIIFLLFVIFIICIIFCKVIIIV